MKNVYILLAITVLLSSFIRYSKNKEGLRFSDKVQNKRENQK